MCPEYITTSAILILPQGAANYAGFYYSVSDYSSIAELKDTKYNLMT